MLDAFGASTQHLLLAETLGLAMARRASDILERHRAALTAGPEPADAPPEADDEEFACDNAIFTAVLDAANECLGRFDTRPADDRWCDALLQVIYLAQLSAVTGDRPVSRPPAPSSRAGGRTVEERQKGSGEEVSGERGSGEEASWERGSR